MKIFSMKSESDSLCDYHFQAPGSKDILSNPCDSSGLTLILWSDAIGYFHYVFTTFLGLEEW